MKTTLRFASALAPALVAVALASPVLAQPLKVEVWTDKGNDAVYQPGDAMQVRARVNSDAYLLVYEIDSDGFVHVIFPSRGEDNRAPGDQTLNIPDASSDRELVVENNTGLDYMVAIASRNPFDNLPWYLRQEDATGDAMGYVNQPQADEEGVTTDGRIVGDPFVAMERIRRRVVAVPNDASSFATAYTSYYVHEQVQYPRYICNDCHRPGHWSWWDGWDPYYSTCSVVDFHVNWSWVWGPSYWYGYVPYYVYSYRPGCAPQWRWPGGSWCSSWDGWNHWTQYWNGGLVRYKSPPPVGYRSPATYPNWRGGAAPAPPGMLVTGRNSRVPGGTGGPLAGTTVSRMRGAERMPVSRGDLGGADVVTRNLRGGSERTPQADRMPATRSGDAVYTRPDRQVMRSPASPWRSPDSPRYTRTPMDRFPSERSPAGRAPIERMRGGNSGGGERISAPRESYRGGGSGGRVAPAQGGGRAAPAHGGGRAAPAQGGRGGGGGGRGER